MPTSAEFKKDLQANMADEANFRRVFSTVFKEADRDIKQLISDAKEDEIPKLQKHQEELRAIKKVSRMLLFPPSSASAVRKRVQAELVVKLLEYDPTLMRKFTDVMKRGPGLEDRLEYFREAYGVMGKAVYKAYSLVDSMDSDAQALLKVGLGAAALALGWSVYKSRKTKKAARTKQLDVDTYLARHSYTLKRLQEDIAFLVSKIDGVTMGDLPSKKSAALRTASGSS